jgi:hypothetical protein
MKKIFAMLFMLLSASASFAQHGDDAVVRWKSILGVIATQQDTNPVSNNIDSGTFAWTTAGGHARVNLATGAAAFTVEGLVINGSQFSGTPGPITSVTGTLVCNAGIPGQEFTVDSPPVDLSPLGNARFSGSLSDGPISSCGNPLFLIRIFNIPPARGRWIATGAQRFFGDDE